MNRWNLICDDAGKSLEQYFTSIEQSVEVAANQAADQLDRIVLVENGIAGNHVNQAERSPEQIETLDAYLHNYSERLWEVFSSIAEHTRGVVTYYYCISPEISETEHGFFYSRVGKTGFDAQPPLDARELDPEDIEHTTWYYTPIQRGRPSWVGPYTAHFLNELWILSYLVPIYRAGTLIGVLGMDIPVSTLTEQIESIQVYDSGYAFLLDAEGKVLYHPSLESGSFPDLGTLRLPEDLSQLPSSGNTPLRYSFDGEQRQMSFTTLSNGMKLAIVAPVREINAGWSSLIRSVLLISAAVIVVFAVATYFLLRLLTRPLLTLTAASRKLADADYDVELTYEGQDEVGELTKAFLRMRDRIKDYIEDLNRRVFTDDLTGLPNTRYFYVLAAEERDRLMELGEAPVLLFINLLGMKHFNRQYGLEEGDRYLREIAALLTRYFGENCVSRFSQDHFAAVSREAGLEETLRKLFEDCRRANEGRGLPVRVGIYRHSMEPVGVSVAGDRAKFACDLGRGAYVSGYNYFTRAMLESVEQTRYIIDRLDEALEQQRIRVYYQPIVRAATGEVCDEEALSRWFDPERGMLSPGVFIPVLEKARLIYKLDLYVLDQMLRHMQALAEAGQPVVPQSLNLSRSDFDSCDIVEEIRSRVDAAGIPRRWLSIEITESMVGSDFDFMKRQIRRFQDLGFPVWMDDFGSGYSSLDVLQDIHFDLIKFDMRFMQRFDEGEESKIILTELLRMAQGLGIETVCEGVETDQQVAFLRTAGCVKLQGFYFSKPIPFENRLNGKTKLRYEQVDEQE